MARDPKRGWLLVRFGWRCVAVACGLWLMSAPATVQAQSRSARADEATGLKECTAGERRLWDEAKGDTLGIFVADEGFAIGGAVGKVKVPKGNGYRAITNLVAGYHPVSGFKELACGTLKYWTLFKFGKNELDLHPHVELSSRYLPLIEGLGHNERPDQTCDGCIWGEVTTPQTFEWFWSADPKDPTKTLPRPTGDGSYGCGPKVPLPSGEQAKWGRCHGLTEDMVDGQFCMYGPWITEKAHQYRPEIHPVQAFWGQTDGRAYLYLLDDASDRFVAEKQFANTYLSRPVGADAPPRFRPWSGQARNVTVYQLVRAAANRRPRLEWQDDRRTGRRRTSDEIGSNTLDVVAPDWAVPHQVSACTVGADTQILLAATVRMEPHAWRGLTIEGQDTQVNYSRPRPQPQTRSSQRTKIDEEDGWRVVATTAWNDVRSVSSIARQRNAEEWGVLPDVTRWHAVPTQDVVVDVAPENGATRSRPTGVKAKWAITVTGLDPDRPYRSSDVQLTLGYPRDVDVTVNDDVLVRREDRSPTRPFKLELRVRGPTLGPNLLVPNVKVDVSVTFTVPQPNGVAQTLSYSTVLHSLAPNFVAEVSGYDLDEMGGAFPERLLNVLAPIATGKCGVTRSGFVDDLNGAVAPRPEPPGPELIASRRRRAAGVVRQIVNQSLLDETLSVDELTELNKVFGIYQNECKADLQGLR